MNKFFRGIWVMGAVAAFLSVTNVYAQPAANDVEFAADHSLIDEESLTITMTGNVHLSNPEMELKADNVVVQLMASGEDNEDIAFQTLNADGNVWGRSDDIFITSNSMTYEDQSQYAVFKGDVHVTQNQNTVQSSEVRMNLETGVYELIGGVRGKLSGSF